MPIQVFVLESPNDADFYEGRSEGFALARALRVAGITVETRSVCSQAMFQRGLNDFLEICRQTLAPQLLPLLHISAHGNRDGIALTDGRMITWNQLAEFLVPINTQLRGQLDLGLSSCNGFHAITMAMARELNGPRAFNMLVGPNFEPTWGEALIGYAAFYFQLTRSQNLETAMAALKAASGKNEWYVLSADTARELFNNQVNAANDQGGA
jgi:hypothetical protein